MTASVLHDVGCESNGNCFTLRIRDQTKCERENLRRLHKWVALFLSIDTIRSEESRIEVCLNLNKQLVVSRGILTSAERAGCFCCDLCEIGVVRARRQSIDGWHS